MAIIDPGINRVYSVFFEEKECIPAKTVEYKIWIGFPSKWIFILPILTDPLWKIVKMPFKKLSKNISGRRNSPSPNSF